MTFPCLRTAALAAIISWSAAAQDVAGPLTIQGLDGFGFQGARSRAMGGTGVASGNDVSVLFTNPAGLLSLDRPEVRAGGSFTAVRTRQTQQWIPNRFYAGLSLMCEDLTDGIRDPDPLPPNRADGVQRPYDDIGPNWSRESTEFRPTIAAAGAPFTIGDLRCAAGVGYARLADLTTYFQNNNALAPNIGAYRPAPLPVVTGTDSLKVQWYQFLRSRTGTLGGITPGVAAELPGGVSLGASATILTGSSEDREQRVERGLLTFFYDKFRSDSISGVVTTNGTSTYTGVIPALGAILRQEVFTLGLSVRLPMTMTRYWERTIRTDTAGTSTVRTEEGKDLLEMPLAVSLGGVLHPGPTVDVTIDYDIRNNGDTRYTPAGGAALHPWLNGNTFRAGVEYRPAPWLDLRGGVRQTAAAFAAAGAALQDEPVSGTAYAAGAGFRVDMVRVDVAYEYAYLRYDDAWQSNINYNRVHTHTVWLEAGYRF